MFKSLLKERYGLKEEDYVSVPAPKAADEGEAEAGDGDDAPDTTAPDTTAPDTTAPDV
jgi:hypothetical protein